MGANGFVGSELCARLIRDLAKVLIRADLLVLNLQLLRLLRCVAFRQKPTLRLTWQA